MPTSLTAGVVTGQPVGRRLSRGAWTGVYPGALHAGDHPRTVPVCLDLPERYPLRRAGPMSRYRPASGGRGLVRAENQRFLDLTPLAAGRTRAVHGGGGQGLRPVQPWTRAALHGQLAGRQISRPSVADRPLPVSSGLGRRLSTPVLRWWSVNSRRICSRTRAAHGGSRGGSSGTRTVTPLPLGLVGCGRS